MTVHIGLKSDPIEHRYSFEWLLDLMRELRVHRLQLGSFPDLYALEDGFFAELRRTAERRDVWVASCFTAHRDLGGFMSGNPYRERAARRLYERYIQVAALLGARSVGGNVGSVYRDRMEDKEQGLACYLRHMRELMAVARSAGLASLNLEPMSALAEPPTLPQELHGLLGELNGYHRRHPQETVPVRVCADIGHGYADESRRVVHDNWSLFEEAVPYMAEFHFKNTDRVFEASFGFDPAERERGIVELSRLKALIQRNAERFPTGEVTGYLELGGPKLGRDYSDPELGRSIAASIAAIQEVFHG